jgi:hypothetical protein
MTRWPSATGGRGAPTSPRQAEAPGRAALTARVASSLATPVTSVSVAATAPSTIAAAARLRHGGIGIEIEVVGGP